MKENAINKNKSSKKEAEEQRKARLFDNAEIFIEHSSRVKLREIDREVFARNLGRMFKNYEEQSGKSVRSVFIDLYGEDVGISKNSKRKTLILVDGEDIPEYPLKAYPHDYIEIAKHITFSKNRNKKEIQKISENEKKELENLSISKLIEGSSFDDRKSHGDRNRAECLDAIYNCIDRSIGLVQRSLDLNRLIAWEEWFPNLSIPDEGFLNFISNKHIDPTNKLRPSITIGNFETVIDGIKGINLGSVDQCEDEKIIETLQGRLSALIVEAGMPAVNDFFMYDLEPGDNDHAPFEMIFDGLSAHTSSLDLTFDRTLEFQLKYDDLMERWKAFLIVRSIVDPGVNFSTNYKFLKSEYEAVEPLILGWQVSDLSITDLELVAFKNNSDEWNVFYIDASFGASLFEADEQYDLIEFNGELETIQGEGRFFGETSFSVTERTEKFEDMIMEPLYILSDFERGKRDQYVFAPERSIASFILKSFYYGLENGKKFDDILLDDAKQKFDLVKRFFNSKSQEFNQFVEKRGEKNGV